MGEAQLAQLAQAARDIALHRSDADLMHVGGWVAWGLLLRLGWIDLVMVWTPYWLGRLHNTSYVCSLSCGGGLWLHAPAVLAACSLRRFGSRTTHVKHRR